MKHRLQNAALVLVSLAVGFLGCEFGLRALGYYGERAGDVTNVYLVPDDDILDYRLTPNARWIHNGLPRRTNDKGWHDTDHSYEKPDGVFRIVTLGDSVTNGHGVLMEDVYAKVLERRANFGLGGAEVEVIMLAIGALNTMQEAHLLEIEGVRYDPDLVLVGYVLNDPSPGTSLRRSRAREESRGLMHRVKQYLKQSSVIYYTYRAVENLGWTIGVRLGSGADEGFSRRQEDYYDRLHSSPKSWQRVVDGMTKIAAVSRRIDAKVVVVIFPIIYNLQNYPWTHVHEKVANLARGLGFEVLDLTEVYRAHDEKSLRLGWGDHSHPNVKGHAVAGAAIHDFLCARGLIPRSCAAD